MDGGSAKRGLVEGGELGLACPARALLFGSGSRCVTSEMSTGGAQAVACYNHSDHLVIYKYLQATVDVSSTTRNLSR